ncbi:mercury resistance system transport protein MerF [Piscinibacter sakaiensis]|uniref:mercury resistance system transport protein MerF n=1 Tax=Piscinibacter sakaiensis TaxID=1547922 RepID=UPI003AAE50F8
MNDRQWLRTGIVASIVLAICCVTPVLFIAMSAVGLAAWAGWLDVVLIPAFLASLALTWWAWRRCRRDKACAADSGAPARLKDR